MPRKRTISSFDIRSGPDPNNIPSGSFHDQPDPDNARFYPDRDLGGTTVWDPRLNTNVTLYDFNAVTPLAGDAVADNATGLLMRNLRWMVQELGIDGFRLDATRHFERWVLDYYDQAVFLAKPQPLLDGSVDHVFAFSETGYDSYSVLQEYIRKDISPSNLGQVGGNRDALDFNLFGAIKGNLTANGLTNDWRNIKNASIDVHDDGLANNGSQGVAFVKSHDEIGAYLDNVAHAYALLRPGNVNIYLNAKEFGPGRDFPRDGRADALGGFYGDQVTTLVNLRNSHGRGNYLDRTPGGDQKEMLIYEREKSALVVLSNRLDGGYDERTIQTSFAPGTPLLELTGNAADATVDPLGDFPSVLLVNGDGTVNLRVPRNVSPTGVEHGNGYFIYGVAGPEGQLRLLDGSGTDLARVLPGQTPTAATNGTARLSDLPIVTGDTLTVRLETNAVRLLGTIRDRHADGDQALLKIDGGIDVNDLAGVDHTAAGMAYGFEAFRDTNQPGFFDPAGQGLYEQSVDVTQLSEGVHFLTARAFRHRDPATFTDNDPTLAGDGGPAVFTDFREAVYVDRLPPAAAVLSFEPYGANFQRDLVGVSLDQTADRMHIFLNLPAAQYTDEELRDLAIAGQNSAGVYDRDKWVYGFSAVRSGNQVATIVTFEPSGNWNVQRFPGLFAATQLGAGFGDMNWNNSYAPSDMTGFSNSFDAVLYSQNSLFNPAADVTGDGLVDNRDLFALGDYLFTVGVSQAVWDAYEGVLLGRGDLNMSGTTDAADIDFLYANLGSTDWLFDLNSDGVTNAADVDTLVFDIFRTFYGDANLDGVVDVGDFNLWNSSKFISGTGWQGGDFNGDGVSDTSDFNIWNGNRFRSRGDLRPAAVPEPAAGVMLVFLGCVIFVISRLGKDFPV